MNLNKVVATVDELLQAANKFLAHTSVFIYANGQDLAELDMSKFEKDKYFISDMSIERGKAYMITDNKLKEELYKFCEAHPDRVFRGTKESEEGGA